MFRPRRIAATALAIACAIAGVPLLSQPALAAEILLSEDFEDGRADGWFVVGTGAWAVQPDGGNQVYKATYSSGGTTTLLAAAGEATWANYSIEATLKNYNDGNSVSIRGRFRDNKNAYTLNMHTQNNLLSLTKTVGGTSTTLDSATVTVDPNIAYRLKFVLDGDRLSGWLGGVEVVSAVDYTFTTGKIAAGGYSKGSFSIDNVVVTKLDGPPAGQGDRFVTPQGAGAKDGTSWANAFAGNQVGGLQSAWNVTGATHTLHVGSGTYTVPQTLTMFTGGTAIDSMKTLAGVDTGGGLPLFRGDWTLANQGSRALIDVPVGVSFWRVQDIRAENYNFGILARGEHHGIRITNFDAKNMSDGIYLWGLRSDTDASNPAIASHDIIIKDGDYENFTKSAVRFRNGNYLAHVINTRADSGGSDIWTAGNFPLAFRVANSPQNAAVFDHDIVFQDVVARNAYHNGGTGYWNGDGFTTERQSYNITYLRTGAFDNTDGGYDDKSKNPVYIDAVALRNKRNFRVWSNQKATFVGVVGAYSINRGGTGNSTGLWAGAGTAIAEVYNSTFTNNAHEEITLEDAVSVDVYNSIIAKTNGTNLYRVSGAGPLRVSNSEQYVAGVQGNDPRFVNSNSAWEGGTNAFNSQRYGTTKGYHYPGPYQTPYSIQASTSSLNVGSYRTANVTAQVRDGNGNLVSDQDSIIWYTDAGDVARLLTSRGATAQVQGVGPGTTTLVAVYKGETLRIPVSVGAVAPNTACHVAYTTHDIASGWFVTQLAVTNTGAAGIEGWALAWTFDDAQTITQAWSTEPSQAGASVIARNARWNERIVPGRTARFGFIGRTGGANPTPSTFVLNGVTCAAN